VQSVNKLINNYSRHSNTAQFTAIIDSNYHIAAHHTSPMPMYVTRSSRPKLLVLRNVILSQQIYDKSNW